MARRLADAARLVPARTATITVAIAVAVVWLIGVTVRDIFEPGDYFSIVSAFATLLLLLPCAGLAVAARLDPGGETLPRRWRLVAGVSLLVLAVDELVQLHDRLPGAAGTSAYLLAVAAAVAVWLATSRGLPSAARRFWIGGAAAWSGAGVLALAEPAAGTWLRRLQELLELAGTGGLLVGVLVLLAAMRGGHPRPEGWELALSIATALDARRVAMVLAAAIAVILVLGVLVMNGWDVRTFDLREEAAAPPYLSGLLFTLAAACAFLLRPFAARTGLRSIWVDGLAIFLLVLAADDMGAIHERIVSHAGKVGHFWLAPFAAVAGLALLLLMRRLVHPRPRALLVAGVASSLLSQALDAGPRTDATYNYWLFLEELLEFSAAALLGLGLLAAVQTTSGAGPAAEPAAASPTDRR